MEMIMQPGRDALTAIRLLTKLLVSTKQAPGRIVTDGLGSYVSAARYLHLEHIHFRGRLRENNRAENSHLPIRRRERKMQKFKSQASAQRFLDTFSAVYNTFYTQRHLTSRNVLRELRGNAFGTWNEATAA
jgi:transposase-like protein